MKVGYVIVGIVMLIPAILMFLVDLMAVHSSTKYVLYILYILSFLAFFGAVMGGKKLAMYVHDLHLAREKHRNLGPALFIYFWLFMFVVFLILYTVMKVAFGYFVKIVLLPFGGAYTQLIYNLLALTGAYLLFIGKYHGGKNFLTMWGKAAQGMERLSKEIPKKAMHAPEKGIDMGMNMMKSSSEMVKNPMDMFGKKR